MSSGSNSTQTVVSYPSLYEIGNKWMDISIARQKSELSRLKINSTSFLANSIQSLSVRSLGNRGLNLTFSYALYGKYVDMGVGRGVPIGGRKTAAFAKSRRPDGKLLRYKRKPKPWYSKTIAKEQIILASIMQNWYSDMAMRPIVNIPRRIEI